MRHVVVDTNVVLVANDLHADVSPDCVIECVDRLQSLMKRGKIVIDDEHRILSEYQKKTSPVKNKRPGDVFVLWLLRNKANKRHVEQVQLNESAESFFEEFPLQHAQEATDPQDRKFVATAAAHPRRPVIWQATDSKWLDWWQQLKEVGVTIEFLCPDDICSFYKKKFPDRVTPPLP